MEMLWVRFVHLGYDDSGYLKHWRYLSTADAARTNQIIDYRNHAVRYMRQYPSLGYNMTKNWSECKIFETNNLKQIQLAAVHNRVCGSVSQILRTPANAGTCVHEVRFMPLNRKSDRVTQAIINKRIQVYNGRFDSPTPGPPKNQECR